MIKNYIVNWKNQPINEHGMHLIRTTIECEEDILISVIRRLPDGEYEIINEQTDKSIAHYSRLFQTQLKSNTKQQKAVSSAMSRVLARMKAASPVNQIGTAGYANSIGMGAVTGNTYASNVGIVANENKSVKYINFYAYPNSDANEFAREDRYNIPTRVLLLDDAINE